MKNKLLSFIQTKTFLIIVATLAIALIGFAIFYNVTNPSEDTPKFAIDNFSDYLNDVPDSTRDSVYNALYESIKNNGTSDIPTSGAKIRDNTLFTEYHDTTTSTYHTFIVDIESLKQSYSIQIEWSRNSDAEISSTPIVVSCITNPSNIIYSDFKCTDSFSYKDGVDDPYIYISNRLPYYIILDNDNNYVTLLKVTNKTLEISTNICEQNIISEAETRISSWIKNLGINPTLFTIKNDC